MSERLHRRLRALESVSPATRVLPLIRATCANDAAAQRNELVKVGLIRAGDLIPIIVLNVPNHGGELRNF